MRYVLAGYWPARQDSIEQCADRLIRYLGALATWSHALAKWYEKGTSRGTAEERQVDIGSFDEILRLLRRYRNKRDSDGSVIEHLGVQVGLWNGAPAGREVELALSCGLSRASAGLRNCVTLRLPSVLGELRDWDRLLGLLTATAETWDPDWAGIMSTEAMQNRGFRARMPFVDWMVYISRRMAPNIPPIAPPATVHEIPGLGSIIVVHKEQPDPASPAHLKNVSSVEATLRQIIPS